MALEAYDKEKGLKRRLREHPAIKAVRRLSEKDQGDLLKLFLCFVEDEKGQKTYPGIEYIVAQSDPSFQVYFSILREIDPEQGEGFYGVEHVSSSLHTFNRRSSPKSAVNFYSPKSSSSQTLPSCSKLGT